MRNAVLLLVLLLFPISASCQSFPGVGNGSGGGTAGSVSAGNGGGCFPLIGANGIGNGSGNPYPSFYTNLVGNTGQLTSSGFQGNNLNGGGFVFSMMTKAIFADPCNSPNIVLAMDQACNLNAGTSNCASLPTGAGCTATNYCVEPTIAIYNAATSTFTGPTLMPEMDGNNSLSNANCHDCSSAFAGVSPGGAWVTYGAFDIGNNSSISGTPAFAAGGGPSGGTPCTNCVAQPVVFGSNLNANTDPQSFLCRSNCSAGAGTSNRGFLPAEGLSELGCAQTSWLPGAFVFCSGQTQKNTSWNIKAGVQGALLGHLTSTGAINSISFDTQCGQQTPLTAPTALCNGVYEITEPAYFDVWYDLPITAVTNSATQTLIFNPPGAAACGTNLTVATTGTTAAQAALDIASTYNGDATHTCPNTRYKIVAATNPSWGGTSVCGTNVACVTILDENGDPNLDSASPGTPVCSPGTATTFTCGAVHVQANLTTNIGGSFGSVRAAPQLCNNCFVQLGSVELDTNQPCCGPANNGTYSSNYDNAFYVILVQPQSSGHGFKACSIDGYNCFIEDITSNGNVAPVPLRLLGAGGVGTVATQTNCTGACASGTADVKENMPPNWCSNSVAPIGTSQGATNCLVGTAGGPASANPFLVRCPTASTGAHLPACNVNPPFQFSWTQPAQAAAEIAHGSCTTVCGGMATSGRDLGFDGLGLGTASVHITYYGSDVIGGSQVTDLRISTLNRQVSMNQLADSAGAVGQNAGVNVSNSTGPSGTMYVTWGTGNSTPNNWGTGKNCSTISGTCLVQCKSTDYVTFSNCSVILAVSVGTNALGPRNAIYDMPDGFAVIDLWGAYGVCTLGTNCNYGLYLHGTP